MSWPRPGERLDVHAHLVEAGVGHLRGDGALPDQAVQPQLVAIEHAARPAPASAARESDGRPRAPPGRSATWSCSGAARRARRPDRTSALTSSAISRSAVSAMFTRVGPHIGDEPDRALAREVDALVEPLGERHGLARAEPELARGLLLQRRGGERRRRRALALLALDVRDAVGGAAQALDVLRRRRPRRRDARPSCRARPRACPRAPRSSRARNGCSGRRRA